MTRSCNAEKYQANLNKKIKTFRAEATPRQTSNLDQSNWFYCRMLRHKVPTCKNDGCKMYPCSFGAANQ